MKVIIDNGHGFDTAGKRSPDGRLLEYKYAREIARNVVIALRENKIDAYLLVTEDYDVSLAERVKRINDACRKYGSNNVIVISIHCNAAGNGSQWMNAKGWEAYTSPGKTAADSLAECLYKQADLFLKERRIRKDESDGDSDKEARFYILTKSRCPAVLTENLFQDNKDEVDFLLSDEGRQAITGLHVKGIMDFIK